jgi:hypothetical protein
MQRNARWLMVGLLLAALQLAACTQGQGTVSHAQPAEVTAIEGTDLHRLTLIETAVKRLGIQTAPVREEQLTRTRTVGGEVVAVPKTATTPAQLLVQVTLTEGDLKQVDRQQVALVLPLAQTEGVTGVAAQLVDAPAAVETDDNATALYYALESADQGLAPGQRVRVELALTGSGAVRTVIPYGALIYDLNGDTWVYTSPEPRTYIRETITVDYIDGDLAVLVEGPAAGTEVVTAGAAELYGEEFGVGH